MQHIQLGNIRIDVEQKDIKNIHLSVYPPNGKVNVHPRTPWCGCNHHAVQRAADQDDTLGC